MEEEIQEIKTLEFSQPEEIPILNENPLSETMEFENPSTNFLSLDDIVGGSSEIECSQSREISSKEENSVLKTPEFENPVAKTLEFQNPSMDSLQFDETLDGSSSKTEDVNCEEIFADFDQEGGEIAKTLDDESGKGKNKVLDNADIKNIVDETGSEDFDDMEDTESDKTPMGYSLAQSESANLFGKTDDNVEFGEDCEDMRPFYGPWSEGRFRNGYSGLNDEEDYLRWRNYGLGWHSQSNWFMRNMEYMRSGNRRHLKRRGFNYRREREADFPRFSINDSIVRSESEPCPVGAGLANLGNTCFLNAIVQCFTHTVPLVQGVMSLKHDAASHGAGEFCVLCAVRNQIELSFAYSGRVVEPKYLVENLSNISSYFEKDQQEDAHEFLQCLLDKLDSNWLKYEASTSGASLPVVEQIFGGRLVSQVSCCSCGHSSYTHEPLVDLSLEIEHVDSLESALKSFTKLESIEDTEKFTCASCKEEVKVEKQLMLDQAPSVAALHLKRFKSDGIYVEKIFKKVDFPVELDLSPYTKGSNDENDDLKYELFAVVVHVGITLTSGHYYCYIRTSPQKWYRFDDSKVSKVDEAEVLNQNAYILFYAKKETPWFDSLFENWKAECPEKIPSISPKSVLELPSTSYSVGSGLHSHVAIGDISKEPANELNQVEVQNKPVLATGDASMEPASEPVKDEVKIKAGVNDMDSAVANRTSVSPLIEPNSIDNAEVKEDEFKPDDLFLMEENKATEDKTCIKEIGESEQTSRGETCSPSHVENASAGGPKDEVGIKPSTPLRELSPDIYSDENGPEATYRIPTNHLKTEDKPSSSTKKSAIKVNTPKQDVRRKEAFRYIRKAMPTGRGQFFMAALNGSRSDKKRKKHGLCLHPTNSPKKRGKVSPKRILRPVTA